MKVKPKDQRPAVEDKSVQMLVSRKYEESGVKGKKRDVFLARA